LLEQTAIKVCRDTADPQNRFFHFKIEGSHYRVADSPHCLHGRGSTGPLVAQFAHCLGCNPIILVGCDCKPRGHSTDFYGRNRHHLPHTMSNCRRGLEWIKTAIGGQRTIISCSDNDIFPKVPLEEIVASLDPSFRQQRSHWSGLLV